MARFHAPGDIRVEEAAEPVAGPGEVKIRVRNCSTCGTDVKILKHGHHHIRPPRVMGHEIAARWSRPSRPTDGRRVTGCR
ncbi:alcohol dehydrogenase catalytic domain-containing protein [Streptosporangium lutulentum]